MTTTERLVTSLALLAAGGVALAIGSIRLGVGRHGDPIGALHWLRDGFVYAPVAHTANLGVALLGALLVTAGGWYAWSARRRGAP